MEPIAPYYPAGQDLLRGTLTLDRREKAVLVVLQFDETGSPDDLTTLLVEVLGQDRLDHLLRDADVEPVATAANREVDLAEHIAPRVEAGHTLLDTSGE